MVLATELTKHFEHVNKFANTILSIVSPSPTVTRCESPLQGDSAVAIPTPVTLQLSLPENKLLIKRVLIKCADVNNPTRPKDLCILWAHRISEEYYQQTDEEIDKKLPVAMPVFNRRTPQVPETQVSFIKFFVMDMFAKWNEFSPIPQLIQNLNDNFEYWQNLVDESASKAS